MYARSHSTTLLVIAGCLLTVHALISDSGTENGDLVDMIRRQLMENNYDYMPTDTEENDSREQEQDTRELSQNRQEREPSSGDIMLNRAHDDDTQPDKHFNKLYQKTGYTTPKPSRHDDYTDERQSKQNILTEEVDGNDDNQISKKDLLYYVDENRFRRADFAHDDIDSDDTEGGENATTTVKYSVFTIKTEHSGVHRRSGAGAGAGEEVRGNKATSRVPRRVFVREQRPDEVVLVRLDNEPFPEFRLPAARRQYMLEHSHSQEHSQYDDNVIQT